MILGEVSFQQAYIDLQKLFETNTSFLFLTILDPQQVFILNLGITFLKLIDYFSNSMNIFIENKHSHLSKARNKFIFLFVKNEGSRLSLRYQLSQIVNKYNLFDLVRNLPSLNTHKKILKVTVVSADSSGD